MVWRHYDRLKVARSRKDDLRYAGTLQRLQRPDHLAFKLPQPLCDSNVALDLRIGRTASGGSVL